MLRNPKQRLFGRERLPKRIFCYLQRRAGLQLVDSVSSPVGSVDHLSPPSTSSRLSDSEPDPSDPGDGDDGGGGMGHGHHRSSRHSRAMERGGRSDGASVSSMGSSSR